MFGTLAIKRISMTVPKFLMGKLFAIVNVMVNDGQSSHSYLI